MFIFKFITWYINRNINNVKTTIGLFSKCSSLKSLPDLSKWNLINLKKIDNIFEECSSLLSFPNSVKLNFNIIDQNNANNFLYESLSDKISSNIEHSIIIDSDKINSSNFLNNQTNIINEYKVEQVDFSFIDDSLTLYYDNFYS